MPVTVGSGKKMCVHTHTHIRYRDRCIHTRIERGGKENDKTNMVKYQQMRNLGEGYTGVLWASYTTFL